MRVELVDSTENNVQKLITFWCTCNNQLENMKIKIIQIALKCKLKINSSSNKNTHSV